MLFEPVRKTQDAMFFFRSDDNEGTWTPCGSRQPGAVQTTMEELAAEGMADKVYSSSILLFCLLLCSLRAQMVFPCGDADYRTFYYLLLCSCFNFANMVFSCGDVDYPTSDLQVRLRKGPCEAETNSEQGGA